MRKGKKNNKKMLMFRDDEVDVPVESCLKVSYSSALRRLKRLPSARSFSTEHGCMV